MKRRSLLGMLTALVTVPLGLGYLKGHKAQPTLEYAGMDVADGADRTVHWVHRDFPEMQYAVWHGNFEERIAECVKAGYSERFDDEFHSGIDDFKVALMTRQTVLGAGPVADAYIVQAMVLRVHAMRFENGDWKGAMMHVPNDLPPITTWRLDSDCIAVTATNLSEAYLLQMCERIRAATEGKDMAFALKPTRLV